MKPIQPYRVASPEAVLLLDVQEKPAHQTSRPLASRKLEWLDKRYRALGMAGEDDGGHGDGRAPRLLTNPSRDQLRDQYGPNLSSKTHQGRMAQRNVPDLHQSQPFNHMPSEEYVNTEEKRPRVRQFRVDEMDQRENRFAAAEEPAMNELKNQGLDQHLNMGQPTGGHFASTYGRQLTNYKTSKYEGTGLQGVQY